MNITCPLCATASELYHTSKTARYYACPQCGGIFMDPANHPAPDTERLRYLQHNNDINEPGYRNFVMPLVTAIEENYDKNARGLDFGSGPAPSASAILKEKGYGITLYDPYFAPDKSPLENKYDYIICCEVIEHFREPAKEFALLKSLLNPGPGSALFCMTCLQTKETDFKNWHYRNDITHLFFYSVETLEWIRGNFGFGSRIIDGRLVTLRV
jgi:hypothetical protein